MLPDTPTRQRVAVVIPCHNDGAFLADALASVEEQERCELVVVDDGSDDPETLAILRKLEREGVAVVHQDNEGLSGARMAGVAATTSEYVHPLDADDRLARGALEILADALDADPEAAVAWGEARLFGALSGRVPSAARLDPWRITFFSEIPGTSMFRRSALLEAGGWDMGSGYEDWDLWMTLAERGRHGVHVPRETLLYRQHEPARMYAQIVATSHDERVRQLRHRHSGLYAGRRRTRRESTATRRIKLAFTAIDALPLRERRKFQLYGLARYLLQREAVAEAYRGPLARARTGLSRLRFWSSA